VELHELADIQARRAATNRPYLEFQHSADLSTGLYVLSAGGVDRQQSHTEDEIYYVLAGHARIAVGSDDAPVQSGSIVFVGAGVPHRFHDITEELALLVVFGPAEASRAADSGHSGQ
jgi:mannose-6-phosphate isomerase-like protein (cupin superfamily)